MRAANRERGNARDRAESLIRQVDKAEGMEREARERCCKYRSKAFRAISEEMTDLGKELERDKDEARMAMAALASAKAEVRGLA